MRFDLVKNHVRLITDKGRIRGRLVKVLFGTNSKWIGAGYKGGFTIYATWGCGTRYCERGCRLKLGQLELGVTRNANLIPFTTN